MKKIFVILLALIIVPALFAQEAEAEYGTALTTGRTASLGVEATTTFAWDFENNSTGLETKVGLQLIFDLFPPIDRGMVTTDEGDTPTVRLLLKDAAFTWWNTFQTRGGNYEQDDFNSWTARPLLLTFDTFQADLVWRNYFFRVASSTTKMQVDSVSLRSIFDDVMDVNDRFYYRENQALWRTERYNIQRFPLLGARLDRDYIDDDYSDNISGMLAGGLEFDSFGLTLKAASFANGWQNDENAWLFGADVEFVPVENLKFDFSALVGLNYDKTTLGRNPLSFGLLAQYRIQLTEELILNPFAGFDFSYETVSEESAWEAGAGVMFYSRGYDLLSYRLLDFDNVIPVGASFSVNLNNDNRINLVLSWFDPPGRDSLIENFGGFLQLEVANILGADDEEPDFGVLGQFEYSINGRITPYIRGGYRTELTSGGGTTGNFLVTTAFGCYLTPINFFSFDIFYEAIHTLTTEEFKPHKGSINLAFTIRM